MKARDKIRARRERNPKEVDAFDKVAHAMIVYGFEPDSSKLGWKPSPHWAMRRDDDHESHVALHRAEIEIDRLTRRLDRELWRVRDLNEELDIAAKEIATLKARLMP